MQGAIAKPLDRREAEDGSNIGLALDVFTAAPGRVLWKGTVMDTVCESCSALLDDNYGCTRRHGCEACALAFMLSGCITLQILDRDWIDDSPLLGCRRWLPEGLM